MCTIVDHRLWRHSRFFLWQFSSILKHMIPHYHANSIFYLNNLFEEETNWSFWLFRRMKKKDFSFETTIKNEDLIRILSNKNEKKWKKNLLTKSEENKCRKSLNFIWTSSCFGLLKNFQIFICSLTQWNQQLTFANRWLWVRRFE